MRLFAVAAFVFLPIAALAAPIGYDGARHLLNRVGFGATDSEIRSFAPLERGEAVDRILDGTRREALLKPPAFAEAPYTRFVPLAQLPVEERQREQRRLLDEAFALREWWL